MTRKYTLVDAYNRPLKALPRQRPVARYLRDTKSGAIASRTGSLLEGRDAIRHVWSRSAALAMDLIRNSGRLKGAADQVIVDTVGTGLTLTPRPDLSPLGYDEAESAAWCRMVKRRWNRYARNAAECDMRGKLTVAQMVDVVLRWYMAYGEATGVFAFFDNRTRAAYGIESGTKLCLIPPTRLVQDTNPSENLFQGITHDCNGRAISYRFAVTEKGLTRKVDYATFDSAGRPMVLHVFDPNCATEVRGISVMAPAFKKHIQAEILDDATLQMAILQTVFAVTLTSENPSRDAFEALSALADEHQGGREIANEYLDYLGAALERAAEGRVDIGGDPRISHLAPGERLAIESAKVPGQEYLPFSGALDRDMARAIGITYGAFTMDYTEATYASVRMESATIWPVATRRCQRVAAPIEQCIYTLWLDEEIGEGRVPLKGGYSAFLANRSRICQTHQQGPPQPTADDLKSAKGANERIKGKLSTISIESSALGIDSDELFNIQKEEHQRYIVAGMASPYDRYLGKDV